MKKVTVKKMIENSYIPASLIRSTIAQLGGFDSFEESARDITNHGVAGGFHGFIYYVDTVAFTRRNKKHILTMAEQQAQEFGQGMLEMLLSFKCMRYDNLTADELARTIYTGKGELVDLVFNCLAWYAVEEVARLYSDLVDQDGN